TGNDYPLQPGRGHRRGLFSRPAPAGKAAAAGGEVPGPDREKGPPDLYGAQTLRVGAGAVQRRAPQGRQRTGQGCRVQTARPQSGRQVSMGESVLEVVKQSVTAREAAELYGIAVGRGGMACCPFHDDRQPSMKVDTRFHCFGCGADGDVIDFTVRLYGLSPKEAAVKLALDFGLAYDSK